MHSPQREENVNSCGDIFQDDRGISFLDK